MKSIKPPRFVPTLTEVVPTAVDTAEKSFDITPQELIQRVQQELEGPLNQLWAEHAQILQRELQKLVQRAVAQALTQIPR